MKKRMSIFAGIGMILLITSCSWEIPQSVSVRTNANYNFAIGSVEHSLDETLDLKSNLPSGAYDYFPGRKNDKLQQFMIAVQVYEQSLSNVVNATSISGYDSLPDSASLPISNIGPSGQTALNFNPSTITDTIKNSLGNDFASKITFDKVPVYLYCNVTGNLSATGKMKLYYGDKDTKIAYTQSYPQYILGAESGSEEFATIVKTTHPSLPSAATETVIIDLDNEPYTVKTDIKTIMNNSSNVTESNASLCAEYNFRLHGSIAKADVPNASVSVWAIIVLPIQFKVREGAGNDITLDLRQLIGSSQGDIFQRTEATSMSDMNKYLSAIRTVSLNYNTEATPLVASQGSVLFAIDMLGNDDYVEHDITEGSIPFDYDTVQQMLATYPLQPGMKMKVRNGAVFSLPRKKDVKMNLSVGILTDGTVKLF
jgi:hypothetical protein